MSIKIIKIQKSKRPIWETKLSIDGPISSEVKMGEQAYEMTIELYESEDSLISEKTIVVNEIHYLDILSQYGMSALMEGVRINSLFGIIKGQDVYPTDLFQSTVENIASSIVDRVTHDSFFDDYNAGNFREFVEHKILDLRKRFKIEPK